MKQATLSMPGKTLSNSTTVREELNTNPSPSKKLVKNIKVAPKIKMKNRIFGKELQNHSTSEPIVKGLKTPSTQGSTCPSQIKSPVSYEKDRPDPQMVLSYRNRIKKFLAQRDRQQKVETKFLSKQADINGKMRGILVDWLVDVSAKFKLLSETFFSAVNLLDRYLERRQVQRDKLQLVGITCLMIMSKFEEIYPPSVRDYVCVCDRAYSQEEILDTEADVLQALQFDLATTSSLIFYREMSPEVKLSPKPLVFGEYLLQTALLSESAFKFSNRELACGALFLVNKIFKCKKTFAKDLAPLMECVSESRVKSCAKELYKILTAITSLGLTATKRKFSTVEKFEVSKYKIERASKNKSKNLKKKK